MWTRFVSLLHRRHGTAIMAFSLLLILIATISVVLMAGTLSDQRRINDRRRQLWRALLHAESGIAQVQHWALFPSEYSPDPNLWVRASGETYAEQFPALSAALADGGFLVTESMLDDMGVTGFVTESDWYLGRITQIEIRPLDGSEPASAAGAFFKIISLGESAGGLRREVIGYATPTDIVNLEIAAPLISLQEAMVFGNGKIHWGEAWAKTGFEMLNRSQVTYVLNGPDPLVVWRTEGEITFPANWKWGTNSANSDLYTNYLGQSPEPVGRRPGLFPNGQGAWKDVFYTHIPEGVLEWPDLAGEYQRFKDLALANDRYYTTNSAGQLLKNGNVVDFYTEFAVADRPSAPLELAFIDTTDGNSPAADGSNLATIAVAGSSNGLKGFLYINANLDTTGVGNPPSLPVVNPNTDTIQTLDQIFLDGVIYAAGTIELGGNAGIYGSILAQRGFVGGGTPDIYYNVDLKDGLDLGGGNLGAPFIIQLHNNEAP